MFGLYDDLGFLPSYYLAEILSVNTNDHVCAIKLLRGIETYDNVKIMTDIGNFSLPSVGDICITLWDNRNIPIVIGFYPVYHEMQLNENKFYNVLEGERMWQSRFGQKLIFNKFGEIYLTNWTGQGIELYQNDGLAIVRSNSIKQDSAGVDRRIGFTQRYSPLAKKDTVIHTTTGLDAATIGVIPLVEDSTIIYDATETFPVYENKIGNPVVAEDPTLPTTEIKTVEVHPTTLLPLRKKTTYYDTLGNPQSSEYVDTSGNILVDVFNDGSGAYGKGYTLKGNGNDCHIGLYDTVNYPFANINLHGSTSVSVGDLAEIVKDLKALVTADILSYLQTHLNTHTHGYIDSVGPAATPVQKLTSTPADIIGTIPNTGAGVTAPILFNKDAIITDGTYNTDITKAN